MTTAGKALILLSLCLFVPACAPLTPESPELIAAAAAARAQADYARATANSAEYMARANEMALTATAEAPSIRMTQQAADLEIYMTRQAVDATSTAQSWTPTPSQTPTPNLTATVSVMQIQSQQTVTAKQASDYIITSELELRRQVALNDFYAKLPVLVFMALAAIIAIFIFGIVRSKRYQPAPINERGEMLDNQTGTIVIAGRNPNYRGYANEEKTRDFVLALMGYVLQQIQAQPVQPPVTAARQDMANQQSATIELARVIGTPRGLDAAIKNRAPFLLSGPDSMSGSRFEIVEDKSRYSEIPPEIWQILNAQWENV